MATVMPYRYNLNTPPVTEIQYHKNLEQVWAKSLEQLQKGSTEIVLRDTVKSFIGEPGISVIAQRFGEVIDAQPSVLYDNVHNVIRFLPPPFAGQLGTQMADHGSGGSGGMSSGRKTSAKIAKARLEKVPRPPNAFILYRKYHHNQVKAENPGLINADLSVIIGEMWRNECTSVKQMFKKHAEEIKRQHKIDHPDYQYAPRRPSEKLRRAKVQTRLALAAQDSQKLCSKPIDDFAIVPAFDEEWDVRGVGDIMKVDYTSGTIGAFEQMVRGYNKSIPDLAKLTSDGLNGYGTSTIAITDGDEVTKDKDLRESCIDNNVDGNPMDSYAQYLHDDDATNYAVDCTSVTAAAHRMDRMEEDAKVAAAFEEFIADPFAENPTTVDPALLSASANDNDFQTFIDFNAE